MLQERLRRETEEVLAGFRCLELVGTARARAAAAIYRLVRSKGVRPRSTIDVLIASFCVHEGLELLANDRDFRLMAPHVGLVLAGPVLSQDDGPRSCSPTRPP